MTTHTSAPARTSVLGRARSLADATPNSRNRYVDLLRAVSIVMVVVGHWLVAGPYVEDGVLSGINMLENQPWTQWLTWLFQVMPVFFMVGGFSNRVSWRAAVRDDVGYGTWLASRMRRLLMPTVPLVVTWAGLGLALNGFGVDESIRRLGSHGALVPVWFLAAYVVVVAVTPVTSSLWDRYGWASVATLAGAAALTDVAAAVAGDGIGWANYVFVWVAVSQVGMAWESGRIGGLVRTLPLVAIAGSALVALVALGPYPLAMVGVPGAAATNNSPPTLALLAFGVTQVAVLLMAERPVRDWLKRSNVWTWVVVANGLIMSIYLWHLSAMVLVIGGALLFDGIGLHLVPGSGAWWLSRPLWIGLLALATVPFVVAFARFDRVRARTGSWTPARGVGATVAGGLGLALLARGGIVGDQLGIRLDAVVLVMGAALLLSRPTKAKLASDG